MAVVDKDKFPSNTISERDKPSKKAPIRDDKPTADPGEKTPVHLDKPNVSPRVRKESFLSKVSNTFFGDNPDSVAHYILWEVLLPAAKDTVQDMVTKGIEMLLYGDDAPRRKGGRRSGGGTVISYGSYYRGDSRDRAPVGRSRTSIDRYGGGSSFINRMRSVVFDYQEEASEVLDFLVDLVEEYGQVSVADFYDAAGLMSQSEYTDNSWGWGSLARARVIKTRDGWEIEFPEPERLS